MTRFWLATFVNDPAKDDSIVGPLVAAGTEYFAIEVLRENGEWAVLFSSVDNPNQPTSLRCLIGFTNAAKACNVWLDRGFPLLDATIDWKEGVLTIVAPLFREQPVMHYDTQLLALSGIDLGPESASVRLARTATLDVSYQQQLLAPDGAQPDVYVTKEAVTWSPERSKVSKLAAKHVSQIRLDLGELPPRCPSLAPLATGPMQAKAAWFGEFRVPDRDGAVLGERLPRQRGGHGFDVPIFRFEDVEILGFRIDIAELGREVQGSLDRLVEPLNFHLSERTTGGYKRRRGTPDFRYRAATSTLVIELLRYGRMKARVPTPPLSVDDSQSQHELVVRLLVGRVDDDTAQAHAPAVYVPAIFVDNPWSKVLGRDAIGFDKRLAEFCVTRRNQQTRLLPDGRLAGRATSDERSEDKDLPEPLGDITHINLVDRIGNGRGLPLVELKYPSNEHTDPEALGPIDLDLTLGSSILAGTRWRQSDFDSVEFRRSFASLAIAESARAFRSIQVAPVADRGGLEQTWITGTFVVDPDIRAALPSGVASLRLHAVRRNPKMPAAPSAPESWNLLCEMLGDGNSARITIPGGSWYRLLCSMDLRIDDGLDWSTLGS